MRVYIKSFLILCIMFGTITAQADVVGENKSCGGASGNKCAAGLYCSSTNTCASCKLTTDSKYPSSAEGSTKIGQCYKTCPPITVTLGTKKDADGKAYYNTECEYNIECEENAHANSEKTACECDEHYSGSTSCSGECYTITLVKNLTNVGESPKYLYVKYGTGFYKNASCSGTPLDPNTTAKPNQDGGWIIPTYKWWQDFNGYSTSNKSDGTLRFGPDGKPTNGTNVTTFKEKNTTLYGRWNKKDFTVKYYDGDKYLHQNTCSITSETKDDPPQSTSCKAAEVNYCKVENNQGYEVKGWATVKGSTTITYKPNDTINPSAETITLYAVWGPSAAGHYCEGTTLNKCPVGATSATGSTKIGDCYISNATQFKDKDGAIFTLPIGTIKYQP